MRRALLVAVAVGLLAGSSVATPSSARAYHTYKERLLDTTAYSLYRRQFRFGLFKWSYGIVDQLQVSTYTAPWILGALFEDVAPNIEFKSTFYDHKRLALSVAGGFLEGTIETVTTNSTTGRPENTKVRYFLVPISLASSVRINSRVSTHLGGQYTAVSGDASAQPGGTDIEGATVVDLLHLWGMVEWRLSRIVAFTFTVRWIPYVSDVIVRGSLNANNPTVGLGLRVDVVDLTNAYAVIPGFVFSWKRANIRLGVGYGDFFVESFALVVPRDALGGISPELDVFVRF